MTAAELWEERCDELARKFHDADSAKKAYDKAVRELCEATNLSQNTIRCAVLEHLGLKEENRW